MLTLTLGVAVVQHWRTQAAPAGDHKKGGKQNAWILTCLPGSRNANVIIDASWRKTIQSVDFFAQTYALVEKRGNAMLVIACATGPGLDELLWDRAYPTKDSSGTICLGQIQQFAGPLHVGENW